MPSCLCHLSVSHRINSKIQNYLLPQFLSHLGELTHDTRHGARGALSPHARHHTHTHTHTQEREGNGNSPLFVNSRLPIWPLFTFVIFVCDRRSVFFDNRFPESFAQYCCNERSMDCRGLDATPSQSLIYRRKNHHSFENISSTSRMKCPKSDARRNAGCWPIERQPV